MGKKTGDDVTENHDDSDDDGLDQYLRDQGVAEPIEDKLEDAEAEIESADGVDSDSDGDPDSVTDIDSDGQAAAGEEPKVDSDSDGAIDADSDGAPAEEVSDDELRKEMKERTGKRFDELREQVAAAKAKEEEHEQMQVAFKDVSEKWHGLSQQLRNTGGNEEEIGDALEYVHAVKSGNTQAWGAMLDQEILKYQQATGQVYTPPDPLANHPELRAKVDNVEIPQDQALRQVQLDKQARELEERNRRQQEADQAAQSRQDGQNAMVAVERRIQTERPGTLTTEVAEYIKRKLQSDMGIYPPDQWGNRYVEHYNDAVTFMKPTSPPPAPAPAPAPEAMRSTPAAVGQGAPKTFDEALRAGLSEANA